MRPDAYGRLQLEVVRTEDGLQVYELGVEGKRRRRGDLVLPADLRDADIEQALDDLLHELGGPDAVVRRVDQKAR